LLTVSVSLDIPLGLPVTSLLSYYPSQILGRHFLSPARCGPFALGMAVRGFPPWHPFRRKFARSVGVVPVFPGGLIENFKRSPFFVSLLGRHSNFSFPVPLSFATPLSPRVPPRFPAPRATFFRGHSLASRLLFLGTLQPI